MQKEMNVFELMVVGFFLCFAFIPILNHHHQEHQISAQLQSQNRIEIHLISQHKIVAICAGNGFGIKYNSRCITHMNDIKCEINLIIKSFSFTF